MTFTRLAPLMLALVLPGLVAACGDRAGKDKTLWVKCHGNLVLSGAKSVNVGVDPTQGPILSYPDPVNAGKTGTIPISKDNECTVSPTGLIDN